MDFKEPTLIIIGAAFLAFPFLVSDYYIDAAFFFGVYALLGLSLNVVLGEVGLFDLGHAGFYAIGAYTTAILNTVYGVPVLILLPVSALAAALFAYMVCSPIIHLKGDYLCIVTIGMGEIVRISLLNNPFDLTGGPNGVFGIDFPSMGSFFMIDTSLKFYFYIWIVVVLTIIGLIQLQRSRIGRAWNYIREDEIAAEANGVNVRAYKLLAFVIGAALAGGRRKHLCDQADDRFTGKFQLHGIVPAVLHRADRRMGSIPGVLIGCGCISLFPEVFRPFAM